MTGTDLQQVIPNDRSRADSWAGVVATDAVDINDPVMVTIPDFADGTLQFGPCRWSARGDEILPERGDEVLVQFDNKKKPWITTWWPNRATSPIDPGDIAPGGNGSWLRTLGGAVVWDPIDMATQAELDAHAGLTTTAHGGIVASTDSRLTDQRTPLDNSVTTLKIASSLAMLGRNLNWGIGASPPASPVLGDIWIYNATGFYWIFVYDSTETTYKWKFVGGPPFMSTVDAAEATSSITYAVLTTAGPSITVPRAGDYRVEVRAAIGGGVGASDLGLMSYDVGATGALDVDAARGFGTNSTSAASALRDKTSLAAGTALVSKYRINSGGVAFTFRNRIMSITPIRVI